MGYAALSKLGLSGYQASDTTFFKDTTEYSTSTMLHTIKIKFVLLENLRVESKLRLKVDVKCDAGESGWLTVVTNTGKVLWSQLFGDVVYTGYSEDVGITTYFGEVINTDDSIWVRLMNIVGGGGDVYFKNFEVCGSKTPVIQTYP